MATTIMTLPSHMTGFLHQLGSGQAGIYSYVSKPTSVALPSKLSTSYPVRGDLKQHNLMFDRRVVRGNTYSSTGIFNYQEKQTGPLIKRRPAKQTSIQKTPRPEQYRRRGKLSDIPKLSPARISSPGPLPLGVTNPVLTSSRQIPPIPGRRHLELQTEQWLETLTSQTEDTDAAVQCGPEEWEEGFGGQESDLQVSDTKPIGEDKETQIFPNDPLLFFFDQEVVVVLEAIVGKTLEQSLTEVLEEEETALAIKQKQIHMESLKALEVS